VRLIVDIKDENLADKIIQILKVFEDSGVEIREIYEKEEKWSDEYIEKHWKEILLKTNSVDLDDDERLYDAAARFYREKHFD